MSRASLMNTIVTVLVPRSTTDALGGDEGEFAEIGAFKGRLRTLSGRAAEMSGSEGVLLTHKLYAVPGDVSRLAVEGTG